MNTMNERTIGTQEDSKNRSDDEARGVVREHYGAIARAGSQGCCVPGTCGCGGGGGSELLGYSAQDLAALPEGADLGLGCGNPQAIARLRAGETVLDLGAGAGIDCFLAARQVGPEGRVIGVDMTPDMVTRARANAAALGTDNVDFRLGEIERLPVADGIVDAILSNCVINLSPDKPAVFREAFRVLKPGGRLAISDVVALAPLPAELTGDDAALAACVAGAAPIAEIEALLASAGFTDVRVTVSPSSEAIVGDWLPGSGVERLIASASIEATKPRTSCCAPSCCADEGQA